MSKIINEKIGKKEIVEKLVEKNKDMTKSTILRIFDDFMDILDEELRKDNQVNFKGRFSLYKFKRKATTARNPKTGEKINVPEKYVVKAKASSGWIN